ISYQDQYGAGYGPYYGSTGYFNEYDVNGDGIDDLVVPTAEDASYGARFEDYSGTPIWQWDSFWPESENYGKPYEYKAGETTPVDFFETSHTITNSIALRGGSETNTFRFGYTNWITSGILPNSSIIRHNFSLNASNQLSERLKATVLLNFIKNNTTGRYGTGCFCNAISQFRKWWQVNVDVGQLKNLYEKSGGLNRTWNIKNPSLIPDEADLAPAYSDNPYWTRYKNYSTDGRTRTMGKISLTYNILDWLSLMGRITVDSYSELREERRAIGSVPEEFGISKMDEESGYLRRDLLSREYNLDLILTAKKNISKNVSLFGILGTNFRRNNFVWNEQSTSGGLVVPELYALSNSAGPLPVPVEVERRKEVYGYFTNLNIGYRNFLYLDLAGRLDISSALPTNNNTYPFGSVSLAWIFTQNLNVNWLSFGKARLSYAEVGNDIQANTTSDIFQQNSNFGDAVLFSAPSYKANSALKPERLASWETGLEMAVFNDRAMLDLTLYQTSATNQMIQIATSLATGYSFKYINGGEIENKGIELSLGGDILQSRHFVWSININWAKNKNLVKSLPGGTDNYNMKSYCGGVSNWTIAGQPYGVFKGTGFQYLNDNRVIDARGYYIAVLNQIIGDPNPEWNGGIINKFSYKHFSLGFLIDLSKGGDVFSYDIMMGQGNGLPDYTVGKNDLGNPVRNTPDNGGGMIQEGVTKTGTKNNVRGRADYYGGIWYWGNIHRNPGEMTVYDASYVKLRELYLTYQLPDHWINSFAQKVAISLVGRNLWIMSKKVPYADPESGLGAGNTQGYLSGSYPAVKY
ncbi:MAG: TonB-dependent receptor, partial [Cyclobacteriaceae bacterium]|nr:TonB-dependent receptor [Cyclobacteriaceae bacterium]